MDTYKPFIYRHRPIYTTTSNRPAFNWLPRCLTFRLPKMSGMWYASISRPETFSTFAWHPALSIMLALAISIERSSGIGRERSLDTELCRCGQPLSKTRTNAAACVALSGRCIYWGALPRILGSLNAPRSTRVTLAHSLLSEVIRCPFTRRSTISEMFWVASLKARRAV